MENMTVVDAVSLACEIRALAPFLGGKYAPKLDCIHVLPERRLAATDGYRMATMSSQSITGEGVLSEKTVRALLSAIGDTVRPDVLLGENGSLIVRRKKQEKTEIPLLERSKSELPNVHRLRDKLMKRKTAWTFTLLRTMEDSLRDIAKMASSIVLDFDEQMIEAHWKDRKHFWGLKWSTRMPDCVHLVDSKEGIRHRVALNPAFVADSLAFLRVDKARWMVSDQLEAVCVYGCEGRDVIIMPMQE